MKHSQYWQDRILQIDLDQERKNLAKSAEVRTLYDESQNQIEAELKKWYVKYAENDELTYEQAVLLLSKQEQKSWKMTLKEFRAKAKAGGFDQELNREYYRSRVSRLQQLQTQIKMHMFDLAIVRESMLHDHLVDAFEENYMRQIYEVQSMTGDIQPAKISTSFARYNENEIEQILYKPWKGSNFSRRIWKNDLERLPGELEKILVPSLQQGKGIDDMVEQLQSRFNVAKNRAVTLIQMETKHITGQSTLASYKELKVKKYVFLATLEISTCDDCGGLDSEVFLVSKAVPGVNYPTIHVNCRCTTAPWIEDEIARSNFRWSRDPITGKRVRVPRVSFEQWKAGLIEENGQLQWDALKAKSKNKATDHEQFTRYRDLLGEHAPNSLEAFQDMKYTDSEGWRALKQQYALYNRNSYLQERFDYVLDGAGQFIPNRSLIKSAKIIAGNGVDTTLRIADRLEELYNKPSQGWSKKVGKIESDRYVFDVHWYEFNGQQFEMKLKHRGERK